MAGLCPNGLGGTGGGHPAGVVQKGGDQTDQQGLRRGAQAGGTQKALDLGQGISKDHGRLLPRWQKTAVANCHSTESAADRGGVSFFAHHDSRNKSSAQLQNSRFRLAGCPITHAGIGKRSSRTSLRLGRGPESVPWPRV